MNELSAEALLPFSYPHRQRRKQQRTQALFFSVKNGLGKRLAVSLPASFLFGLSSPHSLPILLLPPTSLDSPIWLSGYLASWFEILMEEHSHMINHA